MGVELLIVDQRFPQQNPVRLIFDNSFRISAIFKPNWVADVIPQAGAHFICRSFGDRHGGFRSWLDAADQPIVAVSIFMKLLRQLSRLAAACLSDDDDHLIFPNHVKQGILLLFLLVIDVQESRAIPCTQS